MLRTSAGRIRPPEIDAGAAEIDGQIAGCDRKLAQYRAALDTGAEVHVSPAQHWQFERVRGPSAPKSQCVIAGEFAAGSRP